MIDRRLHALRMVRQHGTVTAAAMAMHLTPSAVSQQLASLAHDLGVDLLEPQGRGVRLTRAAAVVLDHADLLHAGWERAKAELDAHRTGDGGPVRLCGFPSALATLLGPVVEHLGRVAPHLHLEVVQADPDESLDRLIAGDTDLALLEASPSTPASTDHRFEQELLFNDPLQLIVPLEHPMARRRRAALADAAEETWIGGPPAGSYHRIVALACSQAGFAPRFAHRAVDWSAYIALVRAGLGVALLPRLAATSGRIHRVALTDRPTPTRRILTCVRAGSSDQPAVRHLRRALHQAAEPHRGDA